MTLPGFHSGAAVRVSIVLAYALVVFFVAARLGKTGPERTGVVAAEPTVSAGQFTRLKLNLSASRPVENWIVTVDRAPIDATSVSPHRWSAEIDLGSLPDQRLVIDVTPAPSLDESPLAVRLRIASGDGIWERTLWAPGDLVEMISMDTILKEWDSAP